MEELLERDHELSVLRGLVDNARVGRGGTVLVEGPAGSGKTALLRALRSSVDDVRVLRAVGGELEREFPFGVVRQLFEREVHGSDPDRRARLLAGAAEHAAPIVGAAVASPGASDASFATLHGLYWLAAALAEEAPLLLVVDDAHWCDAPSLRFLVFLARRATELPLLVCVGTRVNEPGAEVELLGALGDAPGATVVRPGPLTSASVRRLFSHAAPEDAVATAIETTGGNPLLLHELVRSLAGAPVTAAAVRAAVPSSVTRSVQRRLNRLDSQARAVARALAVLGDASLLGDDAGPAVRALRELELVEDDPPRFVHPLVRAAVAEPVIAAERDALHHSAARRLHERRDAEEDVVLHLLAASPIGEPWAVDVLREAARRAAAEGAPDAAVRRLRRALEEFTGPTRPRLELVLELGLTAATAGDPAARAYLGEAAGAEDPGVAAQAVEAIRVTPGDDLEAAAATLSGALDRLPPGELHDRIAGQLLSSLTMDLRLAPRRAETLASLDENRGVLAHRTYDAAAGDASAAEVLALAERALEGRPFTQLRAIERPTLFWAVVALIAADGAAAANAALLEAETTVRRHRTRLGGAFVSFLRAEWALAFGSPALAEAEARAAAEVFGVATGNTVALAAAGALVRALVLLDRVDEADAQLAQLPGDDQLAHGWGATLVWNARADVRLAQNRATDALADLDRIRAVTDAFGWRRMVPGHHAGRRARALLAADRPDEARADAEREAAEATRRGVATFAAQAYAALGDGERAVQHAGAERTGQRRGGVRVRARAAAGRPAQRGAPAPRRRARSRDAPRPDRARRAGVRGARRGRRQAQARRAPGRQRRSPRASGGWPSTQRVGCRTARSRRPCSSRARRWSSRSATRTPNSASVPGPSWRRHSLWGEPSPPAP